MLNPDFGLVAGRGVVLLGAVGATPPTFADLESYAFAGSLAEAELPSGWTTFGDTDTEDLPEWDSDGGDTTMLSTWAFPNVREILDGEPKTNFFTVQAIEFATDTMELFEGGGTAEDGVFWAPGQPVPTQAAVTVVFMDTSVGGGQVTAYHAPKMNIRGDEGVTLNADAWSQIPLRFTELTHPGAKGPHAWIGRGFTAPVTEPAA